MDIIKDYIPQGRNNRRGVKMIPKWITCHDTANVSTGADAASHGRYLKGDVAAKIPVSWHFTVSDKNIVQHLPLNESGYHAGDGPSGPGNRQSIGVEICEDAGGDRQKAEALAVELIVYLIKTEKSLHPFPACVKQHFDWSGKNCPRAIRRRPNGWKNFLAEVEKKLTTPDQVLPKVDRRLEGTANGKPVTVDAYLINGLTYVPLRIIGEALGAKVWGDGRKYSIDK